MIDTAKLGVGRQKYYLEQLARDRAEYLSGHGEAPGVWYGRAAGEAFALSGEATAEQFETMFAGRDPVTRELLGHAHRSDGVLAYDLVFRPTKSVSVLYGIGDPEDAAAVMAAHHAGVEAAVEFLEEWIGLRRGRGGLERMETSCGLLAVGFDHRASRAGDPLPHTHLIVANRAKGLDGRWTALDGNDLLDVEVLKAANVFYRNTYQAELTRSRGYGWTEPDELGNCEILGMPEDLIRLFSKAGNAIKEELGAREAEGLPTSSKVANWLAHKLRGAKVREDFPFQRDRWTAEVADSGYSLPGLLAKMRGRSREQQLCETDVEALFDRIAGPEGLTARASTFGKPAILAAIGNATRLRPGQVRQLARAFVAERCVRVMTDAKTGRSSWSTPELLGLEQQLVDNAQSRQDEGRHVVPEEIVQATLDHFAAMGKPLGEDQAAVVRAVCSDGAGVSCVVGRAGTGKTFTQDAVRAAFQAANLTRGEREQLSVRGLAPTGIAALELDAGAGIPTATVDRFLLDLEGGRDSLSGNDVVVIDESNMLGTRKAAPLLAHTRRVGAKVILVGDPKQLQSIDVGGWFRGLVTRLDAVELSRNRRQLDELDRRAVELIREGLPEEAMRLYRDGGRVTVTTTAAEAHEAMAKDWWKAFAQGEDAFMLAHRRVEVDRLNDLGHAAMAAAERLSGDPLTINGRQFQVGDRVVCGANRLNIGIANGTKGRITAIDHDTGAVTLKTDADKQATLTPGYLGKRLSDGRRALDHAYAVTGHKSEGVTVDDAFVRGGSHADQEWAYTVLTRIRKRVNLYLVEAPPVTLSEGAEEVDIAPPMSQRPYDVAIAALGRSSAKRMAIDIAAENAPPDPASLSTKELRVERDSLAALLADRARPRAYQHDRIAAQLGEAEHDLARAREAIADRELWLASHGRGLASLSRRAAIQAARHDLTLLTRSQQQLAHRVEQLTAKERQLRRHEQQRAAWVETHEADLDRNQEIITELGWRSRARATAHTIDPPAWLAGLLGHVPDSTRGRRSWRVAAEQLAGYRDRYYHITEDSLGERPRDLAQLRDWRACQHTIGRLMERAHARDGRDHQRGHALDIG